MYSFGLDSDRIGRNHKLSREASSTNALPFSNQNEYYKKERKMNDTYAEFREDQRGRYPRR